MKKATGRAKMKRKDENEEKEKTLIRGTAKKTRGKVAEKIKM